jgi:hypothetical protein
VLDDDTAILTGVSAGEFGDGILAALEDRARAEAVSRSARRLAEAKYSYEAYLERTRRACAALEPSAPAAAAAKDVA